MPSRQNSLRALLLVLAALPAGLAAQSGTVAVERENFRAAPRGTVIAEVVQGAELPLGESRDRWRAATLEGWIWSRSVREERRDGHDLVVTPGGGENLRAAANGPVVARLRTGMRLDRLETDGNWVRVRRAGWIWEPSIRVEQPEQPGPPAGRAAAPDGPAVRTGGQPQASASSSEREFAIAGAAGLVVMNQPGGDTVGRLHPGRTLEVLAREGDWVRVRVEGWTFDAALARADTAAGGILRDLSRGELQENGDRYRGRLVEWSIQFISMQQAERYRTDFLEGETFILARGPGDDPGFVYVAVPLDQAEAVRSLAPLQRIRLIGRIRTARSGLTDAPVLDLLEITARGTPR